MVWRVGSGSSRGRERVAGLGEPQPVLFSQQLFSETQTHMERAAIRGLRCQVAFI